MLKDLKSLNKELLVALSNKLVVKLFLSKASDQCLLKERLIAFFRSVLFENEQKQIVE